MNSHADNLFSLGPIVLWEALIRSPKGSSQNIVIILLVFPAVRRSLRDYLRIYSGKYLLIKIELFQKFKSLKVKTVHAKLNVE